MNGSACGAAFLLTASLVAGEYDDVSAPSWLALGSLAYLIARSPLWAAVKPAAGVDVRGATGEQPVVAHREQRPARHQVVGVDGW